MKPTQIIQNPQKRLDLSPCRSGPGVTDLERKGRLALLRIELERGSMRQEEVKCIDAGIPIGKFTGIGFLKKNL